VVSVCLTRGEAGSNQFTPANMTPERLAPIREEEQKNACRVLGVEDPIFLGHPDGALEATLALRRDVTRLIRRHRPTAIVCGDPTVRYYGSVYLNHPDHRVAADVTLDALFPSAGTRFIFPELLDEGLLPHEVPLVFIHGAERPDTFIDIADTLDAKLRALKEHKSQMGEWDPTEMITGWAREQGRKRGLPAAEAYRLMRLGGP
jgi:LmbE family N-acetylglucosaminyl deacetylase